MRPAPISRRRLLLSACSAFALLGALPAQALGRLADVQIIDRDSGEVLAVYRHRGEHWVAGRPGARYAVALRNASAGRTLNLVSVDGINAISGETAALNQTGYVLGPWQSYQVTGWRKSDAKVAAFHFTESPLSYADHTGRPAHVGVIGVALFREKVTPPPPVLVPEPRRDRHQSDRRAAPGDLGAQSRAESGADGAMAESSEPAPMAQRRMAPSATPAPAARLGTGHGARETDRVGQTQFERRSDRPDEIIRIRYDSWANLVAMGIVAECPVPPRPNPFPEPVSPRYAPDPS